jgi:hypothetical protein
MKLQNFIFSEKIKFILARHVLFWSLAFLFIFGFFIFQHINNYTDLGLDKTLLEISTDLSMTSLTRQIENTLKNIVIIMVYSYLVTYWLLPHYLLKKKYVEFGSWLIIVTLLVEICRLYLSGLRLDTPTDDALIILWYNGLSFVNDGPPVFCGLFLTIKMLKTWYLKQGEELTLIRENTNAELQLLKAQVHPHFLFNTLNNIYSFALDKSPKAPELVLKLSAVIKYMLNDCEASLVSVEKEIKMIEDYIGLEKVRYGNRLNLQVQIKGDFKNKRIAPFLLIPFVENSFKHGASEILEHPWIKLTIVVNNDNLYFELCNSKPSLTHVQNEKKGIGLSNVEKRLQLLYPKSHELIITNQETQFTVIMRVPLQNVTQHTVEYEPTPLRDALPTLS